MNGTIINHPCIICSASTSMWCSRCQSAWYCSPGHLQQDWSRHRNDCIPAAHQQNVMTIRTPPPTETQYITVSALFFHPEEERPRIVNIFCRPTSSKSQGPCPMPMLDEFFPEGEPMSIPLTQGLGNEPLRFPLHVWYSPSALDRCRPINRAIWHITSGAAVKAWSGTVVVLKYNGSRRQAYTDASANDLPSLSAYFLAYK